MNNIFKLIFYDVSIFLLYRAARRWCLFLLLSSESNFGDGIVSCVDLEAPKFGEFAAEQACNDWDGAYVEGVHCDTALRISLVVNIHKL